MVRPCKLRLELSALGGAISMGRTAHRSPHLVPLTRSGRRTQQNPGRKACHCGRVTTRRAQLGCAGLLLVALLLVTVVFGVYLSLPHHELPDDFDFHGEDITEARRAAVPELEAQLQSVEHRAGVEHVGPGGRTDWCEPGQDNFERSDAYAYTCTIELVQLFPVSEPARAGASHLGEALIEGDCPKGTTTDFALAEHRRLEDLDETGGDCVLGYQFDAPRITGWLRVEPSPDELSGAEVDLPSPCALHQDRALCQETRLDLAAVAEFAPRGTAYLAIVRARKNYYDLEW